MIIETTCEVTQLGKYYNFENKRGAHLALNFQLCSLNNSSLAFEKSFDEVRVFKPKHVKSLIDEYLTSLPKGCWTNWMVR